MNWGLALAGFVLGWVIMYGFYSLRFVMNRCKEATQREDMEKKLSAICTKHRPKESSFRNITRSSLPFYDGFLLAQQDSILAEAACFMCGVIFEVHEPVSPLMAEWLRENLPKASPEKGADV